MRIGFYVCIIYWKIKYKSVREVTLTLVSVTYHFGNLIKVKYVVIKGVFGHKGVRFQSKLFPMKRFRSKLPKGSDFGQHFP